MLLLRGGSEKRLDCGMNLLDISLLRLYRKYPEMVQGDNWAASILSQLEDKNLVSSNLI